MKKYYRTKKVVYKDITFDSSLELFFYKLLEVNNLTQYLKMQVSFELQPSFKYGRQTIRRIDYVADFVLEIPNTLDVDKPHKITIETKGLLEEKAKIKHKIFKYKYKDYKFFMPRNQRECVEVVKQIKEIYERIK